MSKSKVYVGNLPYSVTQEDLDREFSAFGEIDELKLIMDHQTGQSKGFAFITYGSDDAAESALSLNDSELNGRKIRVNLAKDDNKSGGAGAGRNNNRVKSRPTQNQYNDDNRGNF